jgi:hypothetical protein
MNNKSDFHATGKRVRDLPITLDKLMCGCRPIIVRRRNQKEGLSGARQAKHLHFP